MTRLRPAELLLQELGITEPREIDLEAIAWTQGVHVRYRPLDGCEARIIGCGDRAIITVNDRSSARRQRFSIGHELGHWKWHRGRILVCRADEIEEATRAGLRLSGRPTASRPICSCRAFSFDQSAHRFPS